MSDSDQSITPFGQECTCREMLQLVLDGAASTEQAEYFREHLCSCGPCSSQFEVHTEIKRLVQVKCCDATPPEDLLLQIRNQLNHNA